MHRHSNQSPPSDRDQPPRSSETDFEPDLSAAAEELTRAAAAIAEAAAKLANAPELFVLRDT